MKGLLLRLSALDTDAASAVRVIAHFQALLGGDLDPAALVRSTAGLAECPAGLELADGRRARVAPDGRPLPGSAAAVSGRAGLGPTGRVWLERPGGPGPFDELVLEWMAIAARMLGAPPRRAEPPRAADPDLVERVLSGREPLADRAQALRRLGLRPEGALRVAAVRGGAHTDAGLQAVALFGRGFLPGTVRVAHLGTDGVVLVQPGDGGVSPSAVLRVVLRERAGERTVQAAGTGRPVPGLHGPAQSSSGTRVGMSGVVAALDGRTGWEQACTALRFAVAVPAGAAVADHDELGPVTLLAHLGADRLRQQPDVRALGELEGRPGGAAGLAALAAFCRTGTLRQAAAELHLHHSSVAARLAQVEKALGRRLADPEDRFRAQLALYAHRLASAHSG